VGDVQSDAAGRFELGPIALGPWSALVEHPDHLSQRGRVPTDGSEWIVRLEQGCGVRGSVVGSDGKPVSGAEIGLRAPESAAFREARGAEDGSFAVRGVECGEGAALMVSAPGHAPWLREGLELEPGSEPTIEVRLEPGLPLAGRVVEQDGRPVAGAYLELTGDRTWNKNYSDGQPDTWEHLFERGKSFTDEAGRFRFEDLYAGRYEIRVHPPGERRLHQKARGTAGDEALEITLEREAMERVVLEGTVVDRRTGEPVRAFRVTPMVWSSPEQATGQGLEVSDREGRFRVAGLEPGTIELNVNAPGYATWRDGKRELDVGAHAFDVRLAALRTVEVRLLELDGQPYGSRANARFLKPTGEVVYVQNSMGSTNMVFLQGGVGRGLQLPAEPLQVAFNLQDGEPPRVFDLDLERDPSEVFEFRVERPDSREIEVHCLVLSAAQEFDATGLEEALRAQRGRVAVPGCAPPEVRVELVARNARGVALVVGLIEPVDEGFKVSWETPGLGSSSASTMPVPALYESLPARVTTLSLRAEGHDPLTFQLAPDQENGGLPPVLLLRRK
jgi:protocatechuate 3,4-dioxygenase beta subunit